MKATRITHDKGSLIVRMTDDYTVIEDHHIIGLNKGDNMKLFHFNTKDKYKFEKHNYYDTPYVEEEELEILAKKNPLVLRLIEEFDLIFT